MNLMVIFPKLNLSKANKEYKIFLYLLREKAIDNVNEVWSTDISACGSFLYLVAIIDWHSRSVLSWRLSKNLDTSFYFETLDESFKKYEHLEIFNSDQGVHYSFASLPA